MFRSACSSADERPRQAWFSSIVRLGSIKWFLHYRRRAARSKLENALFADARYRRPADTFILSATLKPAEVIQEALLQIKLAKNDHNCRLCSWNTRAAQIPTKKSRIIFWSESRQGTSRGKEETKRWRQRSLLLHTKGAGIPTERFRR